MGLLKAIGGAVGGVLADQWEDYFYCEALDVDVLMTKGRKRVNPGRSSNTSASDNLISDGSIIAVNEGQFMIIVQQGEIVEYSGEPGEFKWDTSTEPSLFNGPLGESLVETFKTIGRRFTYGGDTAKDQRIYFFNTKEIIGNKYGTASPVPFRVVDERAGIDIDIAIRCNGEYSYKITNPLLFYKNVAGNDPDIYPRAELDSQLKSELLTALQPTFAQISAQGVRYSQLPGHTTQIAGILNEQLSSKWRDLRGIEIISFGINSVKAPEEDEAMIKELQRAAALKDPTMAAARLADAQAEAMQAAAMNESAGSVMAFAGLNMANQAGGNVAAMYQQAAATQQPQQPQQYQQPQQTEPAGAPAAGWTCSCGAANSGKFCTNCGQPKPAAPACSKCGYTPPAGQTPRFCPECGTPFGQ